MGLIPKILVTAQSKGSVTISNNTGTYNAVSNPGGFGAPNPVTGDVQGILLHINRFLEAVAYKESTSYAIFNTGFAKTAAFSDGVWKCRALYQIIPGGAAPTVTWTPGERRILLTNADVVLAETAITAVMISSLGTDVVLDIDRSKPITSTEFYVQTPVTGTGTGSLWVGYEAVAYFKVQDAVEDCLVGKIGKDALKAFPDGCNCCSEVMDINNRLYAAGVFFANANYPATHELLKGLYDYCTVNCNC